jgi:hypothetical protein
VILELDELPALSQFRCLSLVDEISAVYIECLASVLGARRRVDRHSTVVDWD